MIIYNIRKNGPYEKDKFILNVGQLHNKVQYESDYINGDRKIYRQLDSLNANLTDMYNKELDNGANQIFLLLLKARLG